MIIIILLVPVLFQVVMQGIRAEKRYKELKEHLEKIERKFYGTGEN
ncbi:MAG: hypothetical protein P8100_15025 [bacterium]